MSTLADNMVGNTALNAASKAKQDEFYTRLEDIDAELDHYKDHFKGKVVLCNCDDPYESNFFKHFALNFNRLGLKKLIATCYVGSPISHKVMCLDDWLDGKPEEDTPPHEIEPVTGRKKVPYKIEITEVKDYNGDGAVDISDVEYLLKNDANTSTVLSGNGDFRSPECIEALKETDIVVTNPPFSLFREYVALLMKHDKKFLIIGNQNAISYKEFFPYLRDNKVWVGYNNGDMSFMVPEDYEPRETRFWVDGTGQKWRSLGTITWFTNLDIKKRHEPIRLYARYDPEKYPKYDNYSAIEVSKVCDIPEDYMESMGRALRVRGSLRCGFFRDRPQGDHRREGLRLHQGEGRGARRQGFHGPYLQGAGRAGGRAPMVQRGHGRPDNVPGQVFPRAVLHYRSDGERGQRLLARALGPGIEGQPARHRGQTRVQAHLHKNGMIR